MKKRLGVAIAASAALALGMVGTASAQVGSDCPEASSSGPTGSGTIPTVDVNNLTIYGEAPLLGYGESDAGTSGTNVTYSGELAGAVGHGEIEGGSVGTSGVSGSADGQLLGVVEGDGSVSGTTVTTRGEVLTTCVSVP